MSSHTRSNIPGIKPTLCSRCKNPGKFVLTKRGSYRKVCTKCRHAKRDAERAVRKKRRESQTSYGVWQKLMEERDHPVRAQGCSRKYLPCTGEECTCNVRQ